METYTSQADDLYQEANEIEYPDYVPPYTSCYESLLEFEEIITRAREMESAARDIQKKISGNCCIWTADTHFIAIAKSDY